jgi:hypothetical protein
MSAAGSMGFARIVRRAMRAGSQWRLLLLWILIVSVPTAMLVLPIWRVVADQLDHSVHAAEWTSQWNLVMLADLGNRLAGASGALTGSDIAASLAFLGLMPLLNGLFIVASRAAATAKLGELIRGGLQEYGRMLRMMFLAIVPQGIALGVGFAASKGVRHYAEQAILESSVSHLKWAAFAAAGLLFVYANASVDAGRAFLALHPAKRSVIKAWWRGLKLVLAHPLRSLGPYVVITLAAGIALAAAAWLRVELPMASVPGMALGWLTTQLIVAISAWMHFARLFALVEVMRTANSAAESNVDRVGSTLQSVDQGARSRSLITSS